MNSRRAFVGIPVFGALLALAGISPDQAFTQAPFYQGKTITIVAGTAPGGIGDTERDVRREARENLIDAVRMIFGPVDGRCPRI